MIGGTEMITIILVIMFLFALGALVMGLISFGIWLIPVVVIGCIIAKILKAALGNKKNKMDVIVMDRKTFDATYEKKQATPAP